MKSTIRDKRINLLKTFQKGKHSSRAGSWISKMAAVLFWLLAWYIAAKIIDTEILIPKPFTVWKSFLVLVKTTDYWQTIAYSIIRILTGFAIAYVAGALLAAATYKSAVLRDLFYPLFNAVKATPVASFIILALMWFTTGLVPVFTAFLMVLPTVWANIGEGLEDVDQNLLEMAVVYGMGRGKMIRHIYLPSLKPYVRASFKSGFGMAWKAGVPAEVIGRPDLSIGKNLYHAKITLEIPDLFAWTFTVVAISILLEKLLSLAVREK